MQIIKVNPRDCTKWKYADRSMFEYGDTNLLAEDIKRNGQIEPVFLRPIKEVGEFKYEVIAGNRRFQACLNASMPMKAVVQDVSDYEAAIIQIKENEKVELSDYSKGMSFFKLKQDNKLTQEQLAEIVGCHKSKIQKLLCFAKIDKTIWNAVANISKVSAKSAETIYLLSKKSQAYKNALIEIAEEIRKGAGSRRIEQFVNDLILGGEHKEVDSEVIQSDSGQVFAMWKTGRLCLSKSLTFDKKELNDCLLKFFTAQARTNTDLN